MKFTIHPLATVDGQPAPPAVDPGLTARLQASFVPLAVEGTALAEAFYTRLFELHPHLRAMFPADMRQQREKLVATLNWVTANLSDRAEVTAALTELGRRHAGYGARPEHYPPVINALLAAMRHVGGEAFDDRSEADWRTALELISERMLAAADTAPDRNHQKRPR